MTPDDLRLIMGCLTGVAAKWADPLTAAMEEYGINTPARQAAFLAQIAHESMRLACTAELWGPTPAQARYSTRADLGNTRPEARRFAEQAGVVDVGRFYKGTGSFR